MSAHLYDDETLIRRVDGELDAAAGEAIDVAALSDPALAARLSGLRRLRAAARDAFPVQADPRDADLARLIAAGPARAPSPLSGLTRALAAAFTPRASAVWGGLATAAFVAGVFVAPLMRDPGFQVGPEGQVADAGLVRTLDARLAADGPDGDGRVVGVTFRDRDGQWCRTFVARGDGVGGLACRSDGGWRLRALAPLERQGGGEVRTAASDTPEVVLNAVDAALAGETLDAAAEARARDGGWARG